jgi:hypothetical protein
MKVKFTKGLFGKKWLLELPQKFVDNCEVENNVPVLQAEFGDKFVVLASSEENLTKNKKRAVDAVFGSDNEVVITANKARELVAYKDVTGLFEFRGEVYYRERKGSSGKHIASNKSFTDKIKELYPDQFMKASSSDISDLLVTPLIIL